MSVLITDFPDDLARLGREDYHKPAHEFFPVRVSVDDVGFYRYVDGQIAAYEAEQRKESEECQKK